MNNLEQSLKELIAKNLPDYAAKEMKTYIENAEKIVTKLTNSETALADLRENFNKVSRDYNELKQKESALNTKETNLTGVQSELEQKERNLKIAELEYQLKSEKESNAKIVNLVDRFVSNPRAIEMISKNQSICHSTDYSPTGGTSHYPVSSFTSETREKTEQK